MSVYLDDNKNLFEDALENFKRDISTLRTGRVNPSVLEGITVESYGVMTALNALANISVNDAKSMLVASWDKGVVKNIEKAIIEADLGLGVINEGDKIRLTIPATTEENRLDMVKKVNEKQEKARIVVRQVREDIKTEIETAEKNKEIAEDDKYRFFKELDETSNKYNDLIKEMRDRKEKEIMEI